jgi:hypothetical protein
MAFVVACACLLFVRASMLSLLVPGDLVPLRRRRAWSV